MNIDWKPKRAAAVVLRQYYLLRGSPARIPPLFVWVAVDVLLWGFITRYLNSVTSSGINFVPALLGAVLLWDFFVRVMHGMTTAFFEDVWSRNFLNLFASPLSIAEYISGLVMTSILTSLVGLIVMLVLASAAFGLSFLAYGLMFFPFVLILFLFGIALGVFAIGVVLRLGPASEWFVWPVPALVSPFAGVFYPIATLPRWMQWISRLLPPAYVFEAMRGLIAGKGFSPAAVTLGTGICLVYILLACWFFTRVFKHAVRGGLIARYSAESLN
ncbi:MAG: ABC transporter permease [Tepidisphaeraceae bacterium]|jgi:ABC-2 type transport system permease protein